MHRHLLLLIIGAAFSVGVFAQIASDRLLPESVASRLTLQWKQDGRVAEIEITNPKQSPVLTSLILNLQYEELPPSPLAPAVPQRRTQGVKVPPNSDQVLDLEAFEKTLAKLEAMASDHVKIIIQPGSKLRTQIELKPDRRLLNLTLREARGRDQTTIERLKSMTL